MSSPLTGKKVLVTGATGFIGGRLVEKLILEHQAQVRALVHNFTGAARIARFPIEMVAADLTKAADVDRAMSGCEYVFHCAFGKYGDSKMKRLVTVEGSRNVFQAALRARVRRVVNLSTLVVHGFGVPEEGVLDETTPTRYSGHVYPDSKLDAEKIALSLARKDELPVVILRPTVVYGPFGGVWTQSVLESLKAWRVILVNGGSGLCNPVFVDDVVDAMILATSAKSAVGEAFLISGSHPVTWKDFYGRFEQMLGFSSTVSLSASEVRACTKREPNVLGESWAILREEKEIQQRLLRTREFAALKRWLRAALPEKAWKSLKERVSESNGAGEKNGFATAEKPIQLMEPLALQFSVARNRVSIEKAQRILGYQPRFDFESGMALTEQWARWANLLG